ncbi:YraN family protein [Salipiger sp.]|uniref:YraN family protein n=2 Tax=Salipiger sp. TaxID=2078585 RepID=UPI003A972AD1
MTAQLAFDFTAAPVAPVRLPHGAGRRERSMRGAMAHQAGLAAEARIAQDYERRGYPLARARWRGKSGEIDLVFRDGDGLVFVEVKKSRSHDRALQHLTRRQIHRLMRAAEEYAGTQPKGLLTEVRFDVALVDSHGIFRVMENAFA